MQIDLLDPRGYDRGQPWEQLQWIQDTTRAYWHPEPDDGPGFWVLTRYADVKALESDHRTFSSQPVTTITGDMLGDEDHRMLIFEDPPNHTAHRRFLGAELTPTHVRGLRDHIGGIVNEIIDDIIEAGEADLVADIAGKLASYVMADLLGIPRDRAVELYVASDIVNNAKRYDEGEGLEAVMEIQGYATELYADRRANPRTDAVTRLATGEVEGCPVDNLTFNLDFLHLVTAAGDTTRNVVAGGMEVLFENPDERAIMTAGVDDPAVIASGVEEMLRWVSPIVYQRRTVTADTEIAGQQMTAGQKVAGYYGIANRDPRAFADPGRFQVGRSPNAHLAFGFGTHFCVGSHLARLELNVMFRELLRRLPDIEPSAPTHWVRPGALVAPAVVGPKAMPVRFTPGRRLVGAYA